ncbi:MAG: IPT/TIG domain-containing protein [Vicinamibacteraceae bacterium]
MKKACRQGVRVAITASLTVMALAMAATAYAQAPNTRWVFPEGVYDQDGFWREEIIVTNPGNTTVHAALTLLTPTGRCSAGSINPLNPLTAIGPTSQYRYDIGFAFVAKFCPQLPASGAVAVILETTGPVVAERTMFWGGQHMRGQTGEVGFSGAGSSRWYFAEGAAVGPFQTFFAIANTDPSLDAHVEVRYLLEDGSTRTSEVHVPAGTRQTVEAPHGIGGFGAEVRSVNGVAIYAERAMFWSNFQGGHTSRGIAQPSTEWHLAEGANFHGMFTTYLLFANPNPSPITVDVRYLTDGGGVTSAAYSVPANGRRTVLVGAPGHGGPTNASFSAVATSSQPFIAERAVYLAGMSEGTAAAGIPGPAVQWAFADGASGGFAEYQRLEDADRLGFETYFFISNPHDSTATVTARYYRQDGTGVAESYSVEPSSRAAILITNPALSNQRYGAVFTASQPVVVERATYYSRGAHAVSGVPWSDSVANPRAVAAPTITGIVNPLTGQLISQSVGGPVLLMGSNFAQGATVSFGGQAGTVLDVLNSGAMLVEPPRDAPSTEGPVDVVVSWPTGHSVTLPASFQVARRTPDPPPGQILPVPAYAPGVVVQVAAERPDLLGTSCQDHSGSAGWAFLDMVVDRLRQLDTRWGYNCKRGHCADPSQDVVAYHGGAGPTVEGTPDVWVIDVINSHCGSPSPGWLNHGFGGASGWTSRGRF